MKRYAKHPNPSGELTMPKKPPIQPFEARRISIPVKDKLTGEILGRTEVGVRVELPNDEYFFYSTRFGSWTRHRPTAVVTNRTGTNVIREEPRVSKFADDKDLRKKLGHAKIEVGGEKVWLTRLLMQLRNAAVVTS